MAVWWRVKAVMSRSYAVPNHNGEEDDQGVILVFSDHRQLWRARLSSLPPFSFLLLASSHVAWNGRGHRVAVGWCGEARAPGRGLYSRAQLWRWRRTAGSGRGVRVGRIELLG